MKVLILAYDFPPLISIGGLRPYSWYKYLPGFGIEVTIVTRNWSEKTSSPEDYIKAMPALPSMESDNRGNRIIREGFKPNLRDKLLLKYGFHKVTGVRKVLSFAYAFLEHLSLAFDSKASIYYAAQKQIERDKPDLIIATGEPFILFKYAHLLARKHQLPWLADYRDGWTTNQGNYQLSLTNKLLKSCFRFAEKHYLGNASAITTASPAYAESLAAIHPDKKIYVVYNGYDEEYFENAGSIIPRADKFVITYAGTIYPHQNLEMFLEGLAEFLDRQKPEAEKFRVQFFGTGSQPAALRRINGYRKELERLLDIESRVPYPELVKKLRESHLLLLLSKAGANWLNAKIFDYLGAGRKILLVENDRGILEKLLHETEGGVTAASATEVADILEKEYQKFREGHFILPEISKVANQYSRKNQAGALAAVIKDGFKPLKGI